MEDSGCETYDFLEERHFSSSENFLEFFQSVKPLGNSLIFRGQGDSRWGLVPNAMRDSGIERLQKILTTSNPQREEFQVNHDPSRAVLELFALAKFYQGCNRQGLTLPNLRQDLHELFATGLRRDKPFGELHEYLFEKMLWPLEHFEQLLGLAQHYGLPTRLLDWTEDCYVACYFAAKDAIISSDGDASEEKLAVWIAERYHLNSLHLPSANLAPTTFRTKMVDCPYFGNPNLAAQRGTFTLSVAKQTDPNKLTANHQYCMLSVLKKTWEQIGEPGRTALFGERKKPLIIKAMLPKSQSAKLRQLLVTQGYYHSRLFPGYAGVVGTIDEEANRYDS